MKKGYLTKSKVDGSVVFRSCKKYPVMVEYEIFR
jgi:hypothetical protein